MQNFLFKTKKGNIIIGGLMIGISVGSALFVGSSTIKSDFEKKQSLDAVPSPMVEPSSITVTDVAPTPSLEPTPEVSSLPSEKRSPTVSKSIPKTNSSMVVPVIGDSIFLNLINNARRSAGLGDVRYNSLLNSAANSKCRDMVNQNYFSHINPQGKSDFSFVTDVGYSYQKIGSNLAKGYSSDEALFDGWMASPDHRANIMQNWGVDLGFANFGGYACMFIAKPR